MTLSQGSHAPAYRGSKFRKADRHSVLTAALHECLGNDRASWPFPVALAVPVEMIESWLILIARGGDATDLPRFSLQDSAAAREFYGPNPPPQLKDLVSSLSDAAGFADRRDWALNLITDKLDPADLAQRSPSFALFKQWLNGWPPAP